MLRERLARMLAGLSGFFRRWTAWLPKRRLGRWLGIVLGVVLLVLVLLGWYWSDEPSTFDPVARAEAHARANNRELVVGYATTYTLTELVNTLLDKPGGYLSNDVAPPSVWLDNMPNWEFGVVTQVRDLSRAMRRDLSRSQSQSTEDPDLAQAEPLFHFDNASWILPSTEGEYRRGVRLVDSYLSRLSDPNNAQAQFYARADNLRAYLNDVETRLGSLSQRLSASVEQRRVNTDLDGNGAAQSTPTAREQFVKTPRLQVDDVFYEARGTTWALLHILKAIESDFGSVLDNKNARASLQQIIRELEATQRHLWSPIVLNGSGFGVLANHSLVMASYISRANAALIDLQELLATG
ncbi:DUF2333 family protein [Saccharospirillum mangrovi]|uniref:DUF2333 family protein n=1 Tax=Saccharospirillum mangrovi TaxID=2161747 RepID=UPI001E3B57BD|nr:DUF2333 family protein [Saccharospirillum mangrovi]